MNTSDGESLSETEERFLDEHSGTVRRPGAYQDAVAETVRLRATTAMPDIPHAAEVIEALRAAGQSIEPVMVAAFVDNAIIEVPDTDEAYSVREWLERGFDLSPVLALADQLKYD
jgi:hypothetical protein